MDKPQITGDHFPQTQVELPPQAPPYDYGHGVFE